MAKAQIKGRWAIFSIAIPLRDLETLEAHETEDANFRQLSQIVVRDYAAKLREPEINKLIDEICAA